MVTLPDVSLHDLTIDILPIAIGVTGRQVFFNRDERCGSHVGHGSIGLGRWFPPQRSEAKRVGTDLPKQLIDDP
jgi:hypothetical protein